MKLKISIIAMVFSLVLVGCSNEKIVKEKDIANKNEIQGKIESQENSGSNEIGSSESVNPDKDEDIEFKIYTADVDDTNKIVEFKTINLKNDISIEEKLNELLVTLKKDYFKDEKASIFLESIDSKGIATINLVDKEAWSQYFQGSTGGIISQSTIIETLLQREYEGEWIKGINVLIDGKKQEVFDHAPFEEIFYRQ